MKTKNLILGALAFGLTVGVLPTAFAQDVSPTTARANDVITWGFTKGITSFSNAETFRSNDPLRRDEAAKFFLEFIDIIGENRATAWTKCSSYYDENKAWDDLVPYLINACKEGVLKGNGRYFMPDKHLSNAEVVTVVIRMLVGDQSEPNDYHWATNYYAMAQVIGLDISDFDIKDASATRINVLDLMYQINEGNFVRTAQSLNNNSDKDYSGLGDLVDILGE